MPLKPGPDPIKWYFPLEGNIFKAQTTWDSELWPEPC